MTNGEKLKEIFPNAEISIVKSNDRHIKVAVNWKFEQIPSYYNLFYEDWWNAEYKELSTKNDLGVDCIDRNSIKYYSGHGGYMYASKGEIDKLPLVTPRPRKGHWIVQPSNKEQGERDFIWWKCSECGQVIFSETEKDRKEFHAFCGRCGAKMESEE